MVTAKIPLSEIANPKIKLTKIPGTNNLKITYYQPGLSIGILISIFGLGLLLTYILLSKKNKIPNIINCISYYLTYILTITIFIILYIFPIIRNRRHQIK